MKIEKILNNNVVIVLSDKGHEQVVMGRGVGYHKKAGERLDSQAVEKIFSLESNDVTSRLAELLSDIPIEVMTTSQKIINHAQLVLGKELHESIHISLTDHINFAIARHKKGLVIKNALLWETKKLYPQEYSVGQKALDIIEERLKIRLPEDEAGFITLHIINAELNDDMSNIIHITKIMQEILHIVKYYFRLEYNEECLSYHRFITHLKFFAQRMLNGNLTEEGDESLYGIVASKYADSFSCTQKVSRYLNQSYGHSLTKDEMLFLTIHIERVKESAKKTQTA